MHKKAIIIGASTGIGRALALEMSAAGYELGLTARSTEKLADLSKELPGKSEFCYMDVTQSKEAQQHLRELIQKLGGMDIIVLNAGITNTNKSFEWDSEQYVIDLNIVGFSALLNSAYHYFMEQGHGHIVSISSVASLLPNPGSSVYNASKAYVSRYVEGIRLKFIHKNVPVYVTDIKPGFVYTPLTEGRKDMFWVCDADLAARQIMNAIRKKKKLAYVPRRWFFVAQFIRILPKRLIQFLLIRK